MIELNYPRDSDIHSLADFAELLCLLTPDRVCSRESIIDQLHDVGDKSVNDLQLDDCFNQIEWRSSAFGDSYPFAIDSDSRTFSAPEDIQDDALLYVLLLICANLPFLTVTTNPITESFERVSFLALRKAYTSQSEVRPFGKNETDYTGRKWERMNALAAQIGAHGICSERTFRGRDSGDGGIDIAAWLQLDTFEQRNIPSALAQCACSRSDWSSKQTEISHTRLGTLIAPTHMWSQILFIPHCFRDNLGNWAYDGEVGLTIIFDRLRIMRILAGDVDWNYIEPPDILPDLLEKRFDLV